MAVTPRIEQKQSQSLLMTPQLRQAINLLQMDNLELNEVIERELLENPLLERETDSMAAADIDSRHIDSAAEDNFDNEETFAPDIDTENAFADDADSDREGYEPSWQDRLQSRHGGDCDDDFDYLQQRAAATESVYELLNRQIDSRFSTRKEKLIASQLCAHLDAAGYFTADVKQLAVRLNIPASRLLNILKTMQTFEPSGIFATSLKECLSIQLADINRLDEMMKILLEHLDLLAAGDLKALKKLCCADNEDMASMIADIRSLNPKPLTAYTHGDNSYIIPDVFVRRGKYGDYTVELNQDTLPRVLINYEYVSKIKQPSSGKLERKYLKDRLNNAGFLIRSLHQRATAIMRVSEEIVKRQHDFLEHGIDYIRPMQLRDIAEAAEMHESTVSRVTNRKYMLTPRGTFELKYFFSSAAGMYNGNTQTSTTSIKHILKRLIDNEGSKVLSDDALVECLAQQSIKLARRTVAKYRDEMGIPTSAQRKRRLRNGTLG